MGGPYRTRLFRPPSFEPFWEMVERRRRLRRAIPATFVVLALLPGIATTAGGLLHPSPPAHPELVLSRPERLVLSRAVVDPSAEPWGLIVDPDGAAPWRGPLPVGAARPDRDASPIPLGELQHSIATETASSLAGCYRSVRLYKPELAGDVVAHVAVDGTHVRMTLSGPDRLRHALDPCLQRAFGEVRLPESHEVSWLHFPLRFTPFVPVGKSHES